MKKIDNQFSRTGFAGRYLLPVFLIFLIPGCALWFFNHVQSYYDHRLMTMYERQIQANTTLTNEVRERRLAIYRKVPVSTLLASSRPELKGWQSGFPTRVRWDYFTFRWMIRIARYCLYTGVFAFLIAGLSVLFSLRSQLTQYYSLLIGWHVLRVIATFQVIGQGILTLALSYWVMAFYAERFSVKLVLIVAIVAICASLAVIRAIFKRLDPTFMVHGHVLDDASAAPVMDHLADVAVKMGIERPNQIIAGIDDNFFVTEHPVKVGERTVQGKTLFVSLGLLRNFTRDEANAVLAHEMAHFSGSDTLYSKKISPLLTHYFEYLKALHEGGVSRPIFYFMFAFWNLYQLSIKRLSRQREFRADGIAAQETSPEALAQALVKISAYSRYRNEVEEQLFKKEEVQESINIAETVASGFPNFVRESIAKSDLGESSTAHPFDSHPPMSDRFKSIGYGEESPRNEEVLLAPVTDSWYTDIAGAGQIETELWAEYEEQFKKAHELMLAYHYLPADDAETAIVLKHFPGVEFTNKKGNKLIIDYRHVHFSEWVEPIRFDEIAKCTGSESLGKKYLRIDYMRLGKQAHEKFCISGFSSSTDQILNDFKIYYSRHLSSRAFQKSKRSESATTAPTV